MCNLIYLLTSSLNLQAFLNNVTFRPRRVCNFKTTASYRYKIEKKTWPGGGCEQRRNPSPTVLTRNAKYIEALSRVAGIVNPYKDLGYSLICEEYQPQFAYRQINGVSFILEGQKLILQARYQDLVTLVDLVTYVKLVAEGFEQAGWDFTDCPLNNLNQLLKHKAPAYFLILETGDENDALCLLYSLIYKVTSEEDDSFYRELALKTGVN